MGADSIWVKVQICVEKHSGRADVLWAEVQIVYLSDPRALLIVNKIFKIAYFFFCKRSGELLAKFRI